MKRRAAVSILEALIAAAIGTTILFVIHSLFTEGMRGTHRGTELITSVRDFNILGERLRIDARSLMVSEETPVRISEDGGELTMTVVIGVTSDGLPVATEVVYRFIPGQSGTPPMGSLERIVAPDSPTPHVNRYFRDALIMFDVTKYAAEAVPLDHDDPTHPAFLEVFIADGRGNLFTSRFHLYSRYSRPAAERSPELHWLSNHLVRPFNPTHIIISDHSHAVIELDAASLRVFGGVAMDEGAMVSGALR